MDERASRVEQPQLVSESGPVGQPPGPGGYYPAAPSVPGRTLGIVGFILSFIGFIDIAGLVISIIAMVQSKRAGVKNGFALAGIIISLVGVLFCGGVLAIILPSVIHAAQVCANLGDGTHVVANTVYTCTPTSVSSYTK